MQMLINKMRECAIALYQNSEQEAYTKINAIVPEINKVLQGQMGKSTEIDNYVLALLSEFVTAYQLKDNLALADLLYYNIPVLLKN